VRTPRSNVLSVYGNVDTAVAFNHPYVGGGVMGVYAAVRGAHAADVLERVILPQLLHIANHIDDEAFMRARRQLKARLLMNLESRLVLFEDLLRQTIATGRPTPLAVANACVREEAT
jgi:processing peptidase subunit alpha